MAAAGYHADDFDAAWNQYMEEYNACNPQIYLIIYSKR